MNVGDAVRRTRGGGGQGIVVGFIDGPEGREVLVRWADPAMFPNPTREREDTLEIVRPARGADPR